MKPSHSLALIMLSKVFGETNAAFAYSVRAMTILSRKSSPPSPPLLPLHYGDGTTIATTTNIHNQWASTSDTTDSITTTTTTTTGWKGQLLKASNIASLLCVLDCTILPMVTLILPWLGWVAASPAQMEFMHRLGHQIALSFVLPVGASATLLNYLYAHRQKRIAALGLFGLLLVAAANAPHTLLHAVEPHASLWRLVLSTVHHSGWTHRCVNVLGFACLLGSNYWSKQSSGKCLQGHALSDRSNSGYSHSRRDHHHDY
jgi:MerC mercury resistance protein